MSNDLDPKESQVSGDANQKTRDLVFLYAAELTAEGIDPTSSRIMKMIYDRTNRRSSPNLVTEELRSYKERMSGAASRALELSGIEDQYRLAIIESFSSIIQVAKMMSDQSVAEYVRKADEKVAEIEKSLHDESFAKSELQTELEIARSRIAENKDSIASLTADLTEKTSRVATLEALMFKLQEDVERAHKENEDEKLRSRQQAEQSALSIRHLERDYELKVEAIRESRERELEELRSQVGRQLASIEEMKRVLLEETDRQRQAIAAELNRAKVSEKNALELALSERAAKENKDQEIQGLKAENSRLQGRLENQQTQLAMAETKAREERLQFIEVLKSFSTPISDTDKATETGGDSPGSESQS